jgi:integrase
LHLGYRRGKRGGTWIVRKESEAKAAGYTYFHLGDADDANDGTGLSFDAAVEQARGYRRLGSKPELTVSQALDAYIEKVRAENSASGVTDAIARIEALIRPALGNKLVRGLSTAQLRGWRDGLLDGRTRSTANRIYNYLRAALNHAWRQGWVNESAAWDRLTILEDATTSRKEFLTKAQARSLLAKCSGPFRDLVEAGLLTGARLGELTHLRVRDFDPTAGTLDVQQGKTGARTVFLGEAGVKAFRRIAKGRRHDALLLPREDGAAWYRMEVLRRMREATKAAGLPDGFVYYTLRHSHISWACLAGVKLQVLAENCGTSVRMIERHYGKFLNQDRRAMFDQVRL